MEIRSPRSGETVRRSLNLSFESSPPFTRGLLVLSNQNRTITRIFQPIGADASDGLTFPVRDIAQETFDLHVILIDETNRTSSSQKIEGVRILRNISIFLLGSRPQSLYPPEAQKELEGQFGKLLQLFTRESRVPSLNIEGAYGRFATARAVRDILKRAAGSDLNLFYIDMPFWESAGGNAFLPQDHLPGKNETVIGLNEFTPILSNSFFMFRFTGGTFPTDPFFQTVNHSSHSNPLYFRLEDFYKNARGAKPVSKTWNTLGDLVTFLSEKNPGRDEMGGEVSFASRLDPALDGSLLRAYRWIPGQVRSNAEALPVYTWVTNASRPILITRNFVTYQALESGAISKVESDRRVEMKIVSNAGRWEE